MENTPATLYVKWIKDPLEVGDGIWYAQPEPFEGGIEYTPGTEIARLKAGLEWLAEVQHIALFHNQTDWHKCVAVTCVRTRQTLEGQS
jgi:hypothetical protein